jgi:tetratricopeptide (TPR) repeat protein
MGKFPEAISDLSVSLRNNPYYTDAYFARGNVFRQMGEAEKALQDYTKVIVLEKNNAGAWNNRAIVKGQLGDFSGAIEDLDMAISLKPDMAPAYYLRGVAKFKTGINGCSDLQKALQLNYQKAEKAIQFYCR